MWPGSRVSRTGQAPSLSSLVPPVAWGSSLNWAFLLSVLSIIKAQPGQVLSWSHESFILEEKNETPLPLSSNGEAKNFLFPRQVAGVKDHAEFVLGKRG